MKPIPDGQKCIICKVAASYGIIVHKKGCPDYAQSLASGTKVPKRPRTPTVK